MLYLVGAFSSIGVLMAGIGLYGLLSSSVAQRSKGIGIRMALGAGRNSVKRLIFRQALVMTATGLVIGLIAAILGNRLMQTIVFGVSSSSPEVLLTVAVLVWHRDLCRLLLPRIPSHPHRPHHGATTGLTGSETTPGADLSRP